MKLIRWFITYIKENKNTGEEYAGHASGLVDENLNKQQAAQRIMRKRDSNHHKKAFGRGKIDKISTNKDAIIGREQLLINEFRKNGKCGNARNAISPRKKEKMNRCISAALKLFGGASIVLFIVYLFYN